jgi:hypothetical protein
VVGGDGLGRVYQVVVLFTTGVHEHTQRKRRKEGRKKEEEEKGFSLSVRLSSFGN